MMISNKSYLEIEVPIEFGNGYLAALRREFEGINVFWQRGFFHITIAFLNRVQPKQHSLVKEIVTNELQDVSSFGLKLDSLGAFKVAGNGNIVVYLTSKQPNQALLAVTHSIREKIGQRGCDIETDFKLHVTLARIPKDEISLTEVLDICSDVNSPSFDLTLTTINYREFRGSTLQTWTLPLF